MPHSLSTKSASQAPLPVDILAKVRRAIGLAGAFEETNNCGLSTQTRLQAIGEVQFVVKRESLHKMLAPLLMYDTPKMAQLIKKMILTLGLPLATCFKLSYSYQPDAADDGRSVADTSDLQVLFRKAS